MPAPTLARRRTNLDEGEGAGPVARAASPSGLATVMALLVVPKSKPTTLPIES